MPSVKSCIFGNHLVRCLFLLMGSKNMEIPWIFTSLAVLASGPNLGARCFQDAVSWSSIR